MSIVEKAAAPGTLLRLEGLRVAYPGGPAAVDGLSVTVPSGSSVAIVGESGSGKSTTLHALLGLTPRTAHVSFDRLEFDSGNGSGAGAGAGGLRRIEDPRELRGRSVGLVPQDPIRSLDPLMRIGAHFAELHRHFLGLTDRAESRVRTIASLEAVGVDRPELRLRQYPHELSGGQRQRILIALALIGEPRLLLADEPTSNLDATVQRRVLDLFDEVRTARGLSVLLVTHDIAVAGERADHLVVMRAGRVVESGTADEVLGDPKDPYTRQLLTSLPSALPARPAFRAESPPRVVLEARDLTKSFAGGRGQERVDAVREVSLTLHRGQTVAVVGESGAGKSTLLRLLTGLERADSGAVLLDGDEVRGSGGGGGGGGGGRFDRFGRKARADFARRVQLVYQNPARSLNPSLPVGRVIAEPLEAHRVGGARSRAERVRELLEQVELPADIAERRPGQLSGGQAQRVAIARALALEPEVVVLDEPVSALDQAVQFALLRLLGELQQRLGIAYLLVSHDLGVVRAVADEVIVMHRGRVEERGATGSVFTAPASPRTRALLDAVPVLKSSLSLSSSASSVPSASSHDRTSQP
ncbi:peptide ABC transporter ATP-binding protein [Streptomyces inusitatus]|uniref:Peptide ABC transporter ATP-binding protein n=1 Tax=Streptomyces inusitatus TaxID=68221 RepID=A0A918PV86_9ACTN|nr:ABC transporter ATP-binding protein [Streptomyces inusitatus]GGZ21779.1 peptide ABC transporter ATP-binding protein [Streptomyces inusitatus]